MAPPDRTLLPPASELESLSDEKVKAIVALADNSSRRLHSYSIVGLACGTLSFLVCVGSYVYLVGGNHDVAAGVVLGTAVLSVVGRMIRGRTSF